MSRSCLAWFCCSILIVVSVCTCAHPALTQSDPLAGQWVGGWTIDGTWTTAAIDFDGKVISIEGQLAGLSEARSDAGRVQARARDLAIEGDLAEGQIHGQVTRGETSGYAFFARLGAITAEAFDKYAGAYQVSPDRQMLVTRADAGRAGRAERLFYLDDGHQVLLFPLLDGQLLSQRGELISFARDAQGQVIGLSIRQMYAPHLSAELYAHKATPYAEQAVQFAGEDGTVLSGTLLLPQTGHPHPALVLLHGAGASERQYYRVYADHFARQGIAALIYDQRGSGGSTGSPEAVTLSALAEDALAGMRLLRVHPEIDPGQVGVWGISQGGRVAPIAAARSDQVAFVIAVSAPGMSRNAVQLWQMDQAQAASGRVVQDWAYRRLRFEQGWASLWARSPSDPNRDPGADWSRIAQPALLVYGDRDRVVPPHDSAHRIARALARGGNDDCSAHLYPGVDHNLMSVDAAAPPRLMSETLEAASAWMLERSTQPGTFAHLPGTQTVLELKASGAFDPYGRYGAKAAAAGVLALLGGAFLLATALAYAAWRRLRRFHS